MTTALEPTIHGTDWQTKAACRQEDPELFFPIGPTGPAKLQTENAKAVCRRCEVRPECLLWALQTGQQNGVWGGLSERELRQIRNRANRTASRSKKKKGEPEEGRGGRQSDPARAHSLPGL